MARKVRKKSKKLIFSCFRVVEIAYVRPKPQTTRKVDDLTVGLTPIDPCGSLGAKDSVFSSTSTV